MGGGVGEEEEEKEKQSTTIIKRCHACVRTMQKKTG
jgi:hypothetical protein